MQPKLLLDVVLFGRIEITAATKLAGLDAHQFLGVVRANLRGAHENLRQPEVLGPQEIIPPKGLRHGAARQPLGGG
jgi:hypothetical protein